MEKIIQELNWLRDNLSNKELISTIDIAKIINVLDSYIKLQTGMNILDIFDNVSSSSEDVTRYILIKIYEDNNILEFLQSMSLTEKLPKIIYEIGNKKILSLSDSVIINSNKRPLQLQVPNDEQQIRRIFKGLRNNYLLYEKLYKDKVWLINSTNSSDEIDVQSRIKMSPYMFFHLMGFDYKNLINPRKNQDGFDSFLKIFQDVEKAKSALSDFGNQRNVYFIIEELLKSEERFLNLALNGVLNGTINIDKLEMKCFSYERMGFIQSASGMILFDKQKAISLGYGNTVQHINTDIILLNDFIRKYDLDKLFGLDFVFSPFDKIKGNQVSDQQSIFITKQIGGGLNSGLLDGQSASISTSAVGYRENDFNYSISVQGETGEGGIVYPEIEPLEMHVFSDEERKRVAQTMMEAFPSLSTEKLEEITKSKGRKP